MIIKLQKGEAVLFGVTRLEKAEGQFGPQYKFTGTTATDPDAAIFLSIDSTERQLGRLGFTTDSIVGQTVEFAKPDKYIDINKPGAAKLAAAAPQAKQAFSAGPHIPALDGPGPYQETGAAPQTQGDRLTNLFNLYTVCLDQAIVASKALAKADIGTSPEAVAAMCATLFIAAKDKGIAA